MKFFEKIFRVEHVQWYPEFEVIKLVTAESRVFPLEDKIKSKTYFVKLKDVKSFAFDEKDQRLYVVCDTWGQLEIVKDALKIYDFLLSRYKILN